MACFNRRPAYSTLSLGSKSHVFQKLLQLGLPPIILKLGFRRCHLLLGNESCTSDNSYNTKY